jgi:hypothetical protein
LLQRILQTLNPNQPRRAENPFGQIILTVSQVYPVAFNSFSFVFGFTCLISTFRSSY